VQLALGASRWRLVRQMLTEGLVISLMGGLCGLAVAPWTGAVLARMILANGVVSSSLDTSADARVIAFTAGLAITVGLVFSGIPAWRASRRDPLELLQRGGRTFSASGRLGRILVGSQIALCLILLVNAGLLVRTLQALRSISPGFVTEDVTEALLQPRPGDSLDRTSQRKTVIDHDIDDFKQELGAISKSQR
jgi:putative ABC transport system permease protein